MVVEFLRKGYANLFQVQHNCPFTPQNQNNIRTQNVQITSKFLQIVHKLEETNDTLAFAVEPLFGSLANITGVNFNKFYLFFYYDHCSHFDHQGLFIILIEFYIINFTKKRRRLFC